MVPSPHTGSVSDASSATILVVDDNKLNRDLLTEYLDVLGYAHRVAPDGRAALDSLEAAAPDAVLLDIDMPEMDGFEVLETLQAHDTLRHIPVIMISGRDDVRSIARCLEMGATDFLGKPFNPKILEARLSSSLEKKRLRDSEQQLIRMRDALINMIVHDLGNPLSIIQMNTQMMAMLGEGDAERLGHISRAASSMGTMIESMLDLSKLESGTMPVTAEHIDTATFLEQIRSEYAPFASDRGLALITESESNTAAIADQVLLSRVVSNLIANALKYARPATYIMLRAEPVTGGVRLFVEDDGPGIPDALHDRVFDRFFQVDANQSGMRAGVGLGLAFCRLAANAMDAGIHVENVSPSGTRFVLTLPGVTG